MAKGRRIFAQIRIKDEEIDVDFGYTTGYEITKPANGTVCIVRRKNKKIFAQIIVKNGEVVVDFENTSDYEVVKSYDGTTCIVSRKEEEFCAVN